MLSDPRLPHEHPIFAKIISKISQPKQNTENQNSKYSWIMSYNTPLQKIDWAPNAEDIVLTNVLPLDQSLPVHQLIFGGVEWVVMSQS